MYTISASSDRNSSSATEDAPGRSCGESESVLPNRTPAAPRHSSAEDLHALLIGSSFVAFGLVLLKAAGLVTGGLAGVALIISYLTGWTVGPIFVAVNLPFFLFAQRRFGWIFTLKSLATMTVLALFSSWMPRWLQVEGVQPAFAAIFGGSLIGIGVLSLVRHRASVGGIGILALYLQERKGLSAGIVHMVFDVVIMAAAILAIDPAHLGYSALSAVALNLVMIAYHRPGRYFAA
jgi:uncharacterized membrane-anchored protein YitT (DUF2179 family)